MISELSVLWHKEELNKKGRKEKKSLTAAVNEVLLVSSIQSLSEPGYPRRVSLTTDIGCIALVPGDQEKEGHLYVDGSLLT